MKGRGVSGQQETPLGTGLGGTPKFSVDVEGVYNT